MQKYGGANMWRLYGENLAGDREYYLASEADAEIAKLKEALVEARGLIEECIESDNEFETEWDKAAKTFLAHSL